MAVVVEAEEVTAVLVGRAGLAALSRGLSLRLVTELPTPVDASLTPSQPCSLGPRTPRERLKRYRKLASKSRARGTCQRLKDAFF